ncbi:UNVERIFIED_CONTAM: hypothetical protein K2H54_069356 [Gekko kuhli]
MGKFHNATSSLLNFLGQHGYHVSTSESTALAASLVRVPALAAINSESIDALACRFTHLMNEMSLALGSMLADLHNTEKATIQNRMAIDYLLLKAGHHCAELEACPNTQGMRVKQIMMVAKYYAECPEYTVLADMIPDGGNEL